MYMKNIQTQKGSVEVVVIIIIVIVLLVAGLYFSLRKTASTPSTTTNSSASLSMEQAEALAINTAIDQKATSLSKDCLDATMIMHDNVSASPFMFYEIHEVHNATCGGDPSTSPLVSTVQIDTETGSASVVDMMIDDMGQMPSNSKATSPATTTKPTTTGAATSASTVKEFAITATNYSFTPNIITVKKGDTVKITLANSGGFHDFKIDEFNVATKRVSSGATDSVTFVANKSGSYEFYCSVGTHRAMGMKGTLVVQ